MASLLGFDVPSGPQVLNLRYVSTGTIVALFIAGIVVIAAIVIAIVLIRRNLRKKRAQGQMGELPKTNDR